MSRMSEVLQASERVGVPDVLERAWQWMEAQGWGLSNAHGYFLAPYPGESRLGVVFTDSASLDGWFGRGAEVSTDLLPMAHIGADGSIGALWADSSGAVRVVGLGSEGSSYVLADSALDFLRLIAIGYRELTEHTLGREPDWPPAVAAVAGFRQWLQDSYGATVPGHWPAVDASAEFSDWVAARVRL